MEKNMFKTLSAAKKEKKILKGIVKMAQRPDKDDKGKLIVEFEGVQVLIPFEEVDMSVQYKSLAAFVGTEIIFVVLDVNAAKNLCIGSRARAQALLRPAIDQKLTDGEIVSAKVINILEHGAYLEVDGLSGLMKNIDFSADTCNAKDVLHIGDSVEVRMKGKSSTGTYFFEAVKKYVSPSAISKDSLVPGAIVLGTVRTKQTWGIFVNVAPGVDALVDVEDFDVEENRKVTVVIKSVRTDEKGLRVRGKILSVK